MAMGVDQQIRHQYQVALRALTGTGVPFVVGGGWAVEHYIPLGRPTLDLDLLVVPANVDRAVQALYQHGARLQGRDVMQVQLALGDAEIDLIHHFAQGEYAIDPSWHQHALPAYIFDVAALFASPADLIWSKVFVASRHRFDGSDVVHLIRATDETMDWQRLAAHLKPYPELLLAYLNLFEFCYPGERGAVPAWLWNDLLAKLEVPEEPGGPRICRGPLLDSTSFIFDGVARGYQDVRQS
ncbi:MAG TPA: nucleotidyltransferase family protein [Chloroflexota bacterium]|nr:nucleotidyltransferase family protein [Chloroflexota bacterium]